MYSAYQMTAVDFNALSLYEKVDTTTSSHTMACTAGACEIIDLTK
jgi:hypothetical protein